MNKKEIKEILLPYFTAGVITEKHLAEALKYERRVINTNKNKGLLRQVDRGTYAIDDVVNWLFAAPRYLRRMSRN